MIALLLGFVTLTFGCLVILGAVRYVRFLYVDIPTAVFRRWGWLPFAVVGGAWLLAVIIHDIAS